MAAVVARMPATEIEEMTQGYTSMWSLTFQGFLTRFYEELTKVDDEIVEPHIVVVDQTERLLRIPRYTPRQQFEY